jgi:serine/threonine-protein kinase RIO1
VQVDEADYRWTMKMVKTLYRKAGLVHADLSEFNIFKLEDYRVLFDMGSAVLVDASRVEGAAPEGRDEPREVLQETGNL